MVSGHPDRIIDLEEVPELEEEIQLTDELTKHQKERLREETKSGGAE